MQSKLIARVIGGSANAALLVIGILVGLWALELIVRAFFPVYDPSGQVRLVGLPDGTPIGQSGVLLRQAKNTGDYEVQVYFNSNGFRDNKSVAHATTEDLFVVGDSFAFGWGVEAHERFSDRLQEILEKPVYNIAIPATNFDSYHGLVSHAHANGANIKNLIISVTMENDLGIYTDLDTANVTNHALFDWSLLPTDLASLKAYLTQRSALYVAATALVHQTPWLRRIAVKSGLLIPNLDGISDVIASNDALTNSAARLLQLAKGRNAIILVIPSRRLWVGEAAQRARAARVHEAFIDKLRGSGVQMVDMRGRLEIGGSPLSYYFVNDGHWNREGHRLAAEALAAALQRSSTL